MQQANLHRQPPIWQTLVLAWALILALTGCASQTEARSKKALAMWQERCKNAGVTINRTVQDVEGIFVLKGRRNGINFGEQFLLDDPYGNDFIGEGYIWSFIYGSGILERGPKGKALKFHPGYKYAEVRDHETGTRYRYSGATKAEVFRSGYVHTKFIEKKEPVTTHPPRYAVVHADISTREEREHWIAGSALSIIDLETGEMLAQRIGYMVDPAQGSNAENTSPWLLAADHACPGFGASRGYAGQIGQAQRFVVQVLKPKQN